MNRYLIEDEIVGIRPMEEAYKNIYYTMAKSRSVLGNNYELVFPTLWEQIQNKDVILYVIELKTTWDVCGFCQLDMGDPTHPEFGIDMLTAYMGTGYGKRAIKLLYALVREWDNVEYFVWKADVDNIASQKIAESIGAVLMQERTLLPQSMIDMGKEQGILTDDDITMIRKYKIER